MSTNEINAGDTVRHHDNGKRGKVMTTDAGAYWQVPDNITPVRWVLVWWDGEPRPAIEDPAVLDEPGSPTARGHIA